MKLITRGKSYSQKQLIKHQGMKWAVILFGLLFLILAISYFWVVGGYWIHDPQFIVTGVAVLLGALVILLAQRVSNCLDNYLINKDGQIGIDPRTKIDTHCRVFNNYLNYLGLDNIKIKKVLVFPKDHITIEGKSRIYIVKKIHELGQYFADLYPDERFTPEFCAEVAYKLFQ